MNINILNELLAIVLALIAAATSESTDTSHFDTLYQDMSHQNTTYQNMFTLETTHGYINLNEIFVEEESIRKGALDWFDEVQFLFPRDSDATVLDVETGKSFRVRRTFGTNHADVEPLSTEDSRIIKEIWGGSWSWQRRAVVVKPDVGGHIIAGSMTGYPHAGLDRYPALAIINNRSGGFGTGQNLDVIKGNDADGHLDIHFLNSRTHGTNVMQQEHQNMVQKAARYIESNF